MPSLSKPYRYEGYKWGKLKDLSPADLLPAFRRTNEPQLLARISCDFLLFFMNSPLEQLEHAAAGFKRMLPDEAQSIFKRNQAEVIRCARQAATDWYRGNKPCPHDFYLKLFHKSGEFYRVLDSYDMILADEVQDLSEVMTDALGASRKRIVIVGDSHQQIYGFRYAIDAMQRLSSDREYELTLSFRFGKPIADLATLFVREAKGDNAFRIEGNPGVLSRITQRDIPPIRNCTILSRTNLSLFSTAVGLRSRGIRYRFERDIDKVLWQTLDVYWLAQREKRKIRSDWIRSFESMESLERYADNCDDFQVKSIARIVRRHAADFPHIIFEMNGMSRKDTGETDPHRVVLSTIHASKGQEYARVFIDPDVADTLTATEKLNGVKFKEEANVAYVGFTRAAEHLFLPTSFQDLLSDRWKDFLQGFTSTKKVSRASNPSLLYGSSARRTSSSHGNAKSGRYGSAASRAGYRETWNRQSNELAERTKPKIGDRMATFHGSGTVVEISGELCLVDLDGQLGRLWERLSNLKH